MSRADLFPACASFGPIFIVIGCLLPKTIASGPMAFVGAGATSYALLTLYKMLGELQLTAEPEPTVTPPPSTVDNSGIN
jgi:hypothetical protein